jgi:hypothetical protein
VVKLSIGYYFLRIAIKRSQIYVIIGTMVTVVVFSTIYVFFLAFQCTPAKHFWTQYEGGKGSCIKGSSVADASYAHSAISALTDWTFGILPVFFVWKLKMNPRTKISVALILGLGFL